MSFEHKTGTSGNPGALSLTPASLNVALARGNSVLRHAIAAGLFKAASSSKPFGHWQIGESFLQKLFESKIYLGYAGFSLGYLGSSCYWFTLKREHVCDVALSNTHVSAPLRLVLAWPQLYRALPGPAWSIARNLTETQKSAGRGPCLQKRTAFIQYNSLC